MKLSECRAVITGASGGIGQALLKALLAEGAQLLLVGRQAETLQELAQAQAGKVEVVAADIRQRSGREAVLAAAQRFGGINALINAAGVNHFGLLEQHDESAIAELIEPWLDLWLHRLPRFQRLLRQQVRPARFLRSAAPRAGRHPGQGSLLRPARYSYQHERRQRGGHE